MPEVAFTIRWPDGSTFEGVSPSRMIERWLVEGASYPRAELLRRVQIGLAEASERVRERYGFACTGAAEAAVRFTARAGGPGRDPSEPGTVVRLERQPPARTAYTAPSHLAGHVDVLVIGGGQAGLTASWYLKRHGVEHLVLERDVLASSWRRQRWDSFCLVTPNWQCQLPEHPYTGADRDGFMLKDAIVEYVESFAASFRPPLYEGVAVTQVGATPGRFEVATSHGTLSCNQLVLAVGGYHVPVIPRIAASLPRAITQLHSSAYKNPTSIPDGAVLVVGTGQSGAQIAEDLHLAGRRVHLCVGSAPRVARFYRGRDCVAWLEDIGHYRMPVEQHPEGLSARREPNHYVTGRGGGHDIDLRAFAREGMRLHGRLAAVEDGVLSFAGDLRQNLDAADATAERIKDMIDRWVNEQGLDAPLQERYTPVWEPAAGEDGSTQLDLAASGVAAVIWATGFRSDWSWLKLPLLGDDGYPTHERGVSTRVPGVYLLGLPWLHTWGSGRFAGIDRDAAHVAAVLAARAGSERAAA
jgi:putative flavoprotein involved in K+ transport